MKCCDNCGKDTRNKYYCSTCLDDNSVGNGRLSKSSSNKSKYLDRDRVEMVRKGLIVGRSDEFDESDDCVRRQSYIDDEEMKSRVI